MVPIRKLAKESPPPSRSSTNNRGRGALLARDMSRTTGGTTVFVGTGPFADAGSISSNGVAKLSKGSLDLNQNIRVKRTINPTTRFVSLIVGGTISLGLGTGDQEGIDRKSVV